MSAPTRLRRALPVLWRAAAIFALVFVATVLLARPAFADTSPTYRLLLWEVPGGPSNIWEPDQILVDDAYLEVPSLDALDESPALECGSYYQVDLEWNSPITDALIAGGVLHAPNDPAEDHAYGALGEGVSPWKYITTPDCVQPADVVTPFSAESIDCTTLLVTVSHWRDTVTYTGDVHGFTAGAAVRTIDPDTTRAVTAMECPSVGEATLPLMGDEGLKGLLIACLLALAGVVLVTGQKLQQRRAEYRGRPRPVLSAQFGASVRPRVDAENFAPKRATDHISRDPWRHVRDKDN